MYDSDVSQRASDESRDVWAIVLAGGDGRRLRALMRRLYGDGRPKQYGVLTGSQSMLRQTLRRAAMIVPPERTVVVSQVDHARYLDGEVAGLAKLHVLAQPSDRGTAAGALLAAHWIAARSPRSTVIVLPADHFVLQEDALMQAVGEVTGFVRAHSEWLVMLGVPAAGPEPDHGWIEPGEIIGSTGAGPVHRVRSFREKPSADEARALFGAGCLWNTLVVCADLQTLIEAGRQATPLLHDRFVRLAQFLGTPFEPWALRQAYLFAPAADFSQVLVAPGAHLAVAPAPALTWCDLVTPDRVTRVLGWLAAPPAWVPELRTSA